MTAGKLVTRLAVSATLAAVLSAACDPAGEFTLQIRNNTDRTIQVSVPTVTRMVEAPPKEFPGTSVTVGPRQMADARIVTPLGSYAEVVRAHADGNLVFCERYTFRVPDRDERVAYSVEIVDGHIAEGCQDAGAYK